MSPTSSPCPSNLYPVQGPQEGNRQLAARTVHEVRTSSMQLFKGLSESPRQLSNIWNGITYILSAI